MIARILFNLMQVAVVMIAAPLAAGVLARLKEVVQSKRGPSIFQPYRDLWKLFHKDEIVSEDSSWIFRFTPYMVFVTPIFVALLIPVLTSYPLFFALALLALLRAEHVRLLYSRIPAKFGVINPDSDDPPFVAIQDSREAGVR